MLQVPLQLLSTNEISTAKQNKMDNIIHKYSKYVAAPTHFYYVPELDTYYITGYNNLAKVSAKALGISFEVNEMYELNYVGTL